VLNFEESELQFFLKKRASFVILEVIRCQMYHN
jgi:hypothetical protein